MNRWLQEFSFKKSFYERPNQKWICGRACTGQGCLAGPDARGQCTATAECRPLRKGDRWHCTRPAAMGGPCATGPAPDGACACPIPKCNPVRSLRSWRGLTVLFVLGTCLAGLLFVAGSPRGTQMLSPGKLSFAHASVGSQCSDCHVGVVGRPAGWLATAAQTALVRSDSHLCLHCHNVGKAPFEPHSLPPEQLGRITAAAQTNRTAGARPAGVQVAGLIAGSPHPNGGDIACATCHQEHLGTSHDLRQLSNQQCQSCHVRQFAGLAEGHPQFVTYPFDRRNRIIFDHQSHIQKHFLDSPQAGLAPHTCVDCHQTDLKGDAMQLKPFEQICGTCHGEQVKGKGAVQAGFAFLSLPHFDDRALRGAYAIGEWPEDADQPITPFMRVLLAADPVTRAALATLGKTDLSSLPKNDTNLLAAASRLAWGIKGLIYDLGQLGQDELSRRIEGGLGHPITDHQREGSVAFLNAEVLRTAFQPAFPHLQTEILAYRQRQIMAKTELVPSPDAPKPGPDKSAAPENWVSNGGWYTTDGSFTLFYRPRGHGDRFLSSWMDLTVTDKQAPNPAAVQAVFSQLAAPKAAGYCAKCHSVDDQPARLVNWLGARPDAVIHKFNRFSHSAHLSLINNQGCFTCHPLKVDNGKTAYGDAFMPGQHDISVYAGNFQVIDKATCAQCHRPAMVRDDCLLCHNYHVGAFRAVMPNVKMHTPASAAHPGLSSIPESE